MKELTKAYGDLLQDKRVRAEQSKYEVITRQRNTVMARYKKVFDAFNGLQSGLSQAQRFYSEMGDTVDNLRKNVDTFVNNRRAEGAQLLNQIERDKTSASGNEDREREKLRQLMERLSTDPSPSSSSPKPRPPLPSKASSSGGTRSPTVPHYPPTAALQHIPPSQSPAPYGQYMPPGAAAPYIPGQPFQQGAAIPLSEGYNPMAYPYPSPVSPPPNQQFFSSTPTPYSGYPSVTPTPVPSQTPYMPQGYIPPPPPPRPSTTTYPPTAGPYPSGPGGYAQSRPYGSSQHHKASSQSQTPQPPTSGDPWAGLSAWK